MAHHFVFADESGDFRFSRGTGSRYFSLCTIRCASCELGAELLSLRRHLLMRKAEIDDKFHATSDRQWVRDEVFNLLGRHEFQVDATILEKSKAQPQTRTSDATFYQYAWYYHAKHYLPKNFRHGDTALISAAALETKSGKAAFKNAFNNAIQQTGGHLEIVTAFPLSAHDPCLQAADYCAWALQRKWEYGDDRSYKLIEGKINSEYDLWKWGSIEFY